MSATPESSPDLLARFSVSAALEVRAAIEDLLRGHAQITVHVARGTAAAFTTRLLAIERDALLFELDPGELDARCAADSGQATIVGLLDRVKVQFDVADLQVRETMLACSVPRHVARIQRRDAYRVRPPQPRQAWCALRLPQGAERVYPVLDISATGLALKIPPDETPPAIGQRWQHCRVDAPGYPPIPCELEARFLGECLAGESPGPRLGCVFVRPPPEVQRALQRYVMDVERGVAPPDSSSGATPACS
ncbi:MAG: flagellar brake protein [Burkholderiaceae bacterium]|nr:flagellar brake protein [Burkholderiaceae bacterium]